MRTFDPSWADQVDKGLPWELLDPIMDTEEPGAALIISIALNKRNEAAMQTGHTEVMKTLVGLCKPDPRNGLTVPFEPVRDKMVELYGSFVDHPDFHHAFRLVMDAGGSESPHMRDLHDFTSVHVNPKLRKLRFEAYGMVAPLPFQYPRLKNALLKWAWKQTPVRTWCPVPPSIQHRLDEQSKYSMIPACSAIEEAMITMSQCASAVAENDRQRIKFIGEVDIGLVRKILGTPNKKDGKKQSEIEDDLMKECSELLALKLQEWLQLTQKSLDELGFPEKPQDELHKKVKAIIGDPRELERLKAEISAKSVVTGKKEEAALVLVPQVAELDSQGRPTHGPPSQQAAQKKKIEVFHWPRWFSGVATEIERVSVKGVLRTAIWQLNDKFSETDAPVAIVREGGHTWTKAMKVIPADSLWVPLFYRRESSLILRDYDPAQINPQAVNAVVSWPTTPKERETGVENEEHEITISVQPELKLPRPQEDGGEAKWALSDNAHPFWAITRMQTEKDVPNCELRQHQTTVVVATQGAGAPAATTYHVKVPVLVNTVRLEVDTKVILEWALPRKKEKQTRPGAIWSDRVAQMERKRTRTRDDGSTS